MELDESLSLTFNPSDSDERRRHMERIYRKAEKDGISGQLTPQIVRLVVEAYSIKESDRFANEFEKYH